MAARYILKRTTNGEFMFNRRVELVALSKALSDEWSLDK